MSKWNEESFFFLFNVEKVETHTENIALWEGIESMAYHLRNNIICPMSYHNPIIYAIDNKREAPEDLKWLERWEVKTRCVWKKAQTTECFKTKDIRRMCSEKSVYVLQQCSFLRVQMGDLWEKFLQYDSTKYMM